MRASLFFFAPTSLVAAASVGNIHARQSNSTETTEPSGFEYVYAPPSNATILASNVTTLASRSDVARRDALPHGKELEDRSMHSWNSFSTSVDAAEACTILWSMEWLVEGLIEPVQAFTSEATLYVFVNPREQGGPITLTMRGMMIWQSILERFKAQLQGTNVWSYETQLQVGSCYVNYVKTVGVFLKYLADRAYIVAETDPVRCLMHDKIDSLYLAYMNDAAVLYGDGNVVQALMTSNFKHGFTDMFKTPFSPPTLGQSIANYLGGSDRALNLDDELFIKALEAWKCIDNTQEEAEAEAKGAKHVQTDNAEPAEPFDVEVVKSAVRLLHNDNSNDAT